MTDRPPYLLAALIGAAVLGLYVLTLAPTTQFWDTSEYIAAAHVLGIPHPPGNPLFVIVANAWGNLTGFIEHYARRINLFAAVTSGGAAACWFLVGERWLRSIVPVRAVRVVAAAAGTLVSATAFTVWNQSVVNEKVYTLSLFFIALVVWLGILWSDRAPGPGRDRLLLLILYLLALTSTNHMMGVLACVAVIVLSFMVLRGEQATGEAWATWLVFVAASGTIVLLGMESLTILIAGGVALVGAVAVAAAKGQWRFALVAVAVVAIGVSVNVFLPIRAAHFPAINEGEPTTWAALQDVLTREQYGKPPLGERQADIIAQLGLYWQYFTWQWGRDWQLASPGSGGLGNGVGGFFLFLGLLGAWRHWQADKRHAAAMTALVLTLTVVLVTYLNFRYGYSQYLDRPQLEREVRERDYFFIASFAAWGVWVGMGLATLAEWVQESIVERLPGERAWWFASPIWLIALVPLAGNWRSAPRAGETLARDFAVDILMGLEPYAVIVTAGDNDTFPLWYAQEVEDVRRDVTVLNLSLGNTEWHLKQLQRRPVEPYDAEAGPAIFRVREWPVPEGPLFRSLTMEEVETLPLIHPQRTPFRFTAGEIDVTVDPQRLQYGVLQRVDVATLFVIRDQLGRRPIYFSRTAGGYPESLGLGDYVVTQGFARKLMAQRVTPNDSTLARVPGYGVVDLPRTAHLLFEVYHGGTAAEPRPFGWIDHPSEGIITLYAVAYAVFAEAAKAYAPELAEQAEARADSILGNTSYGRAQALEAGQEPLVQ